MPGVVINELNVNFVPLLGQFENVDNLETYLKKKKKS